jgi:hypothetical protein
MTIIEELERKFPEAVKFFEWRSYKEIPKFVNAADVCIVPRHKTSFSKYCNEEGIQKILEYMVFLKAHGFMWNCSSKNICLSTTKIW